MTERRCRIRGCGLFGRVPCDAHPGLWLGLTTTPCVSPSPTIFPVDMLRVLTPFLMLTTGRASFRRETGILLLLLTKPVDRLQDVVRHLRLSTPSQTRRPAGVPVRPWGIVAQAQDVPSFYAFSIIPFHSIIDQLRTRGQKMGDSTTSYPAWTVQKARTVSTSDKGRLVPPSQSPPFLGPISSKVRIDAIYSR